MENKIFIDTSPIIYLLDEKSPLRSKAEQLFSHFLNNQYKLVTSTITCMEYLVFPYRTNFKTADSLQLATACVSGCNLFLTNDKQLRQFNEIACVILEEFTDF